MSTELTHPETDAKQVYADFGKGIPRLERRPDDGWVFAEPFPMGMAARRAFRGLIRAMCPPAPAPQLPDLEDRIETQIRRHMQYMPRIVAHSLRYAFRIVDNLPRFFFWSRRRLHRLEPEDARAFVGRLASSRFPPLRETISAVRGIVLSTYFDQDEVHEALDYAPRMFMKNRIDLRQRMLTGYEPTQTDMIPVAAGLEA